jgi:hypothetical protein
MSHRRTSSYVQLTDRPSRFKEVECSLLSPPPQPFPTRNFYQGFRDIVSTSASYEYLHENPASPIYGIDHVKYVLLQILLVGRLSWNFR